MHRGQEIYVFFGRYGHIGTASLIFSCFILGAVIYKTMKIAINTNSNNYNDLINKIMPGRDKVIVDILKIVVTSFLGISFMVMVAGVGTYFEQEFCIPKQIGSAILCVLCMLIMNKTNGLVKTNTVLVPILFLVILMLGILFKDERIIIKTQENNIGVAFFNAITYASYNSIALIPILISLKGICNTKKDALLTASVCAIVLIILGLTVLYVVNRSKKC